jgi:hypothetical protein
MTTTIRDGVYFIFPEGSAWIAAEYRDGKYQDTAHEADADMPAAPGDKWAGVVPSDSDVEVDADLSDAIVRNYVGDDADVTMYVVTRPAPIYTLEMRDDGGSSEDVEFVGEPPTAKEIADECEEWVSGGEWGTDGASISVGWTVTDEDGDEVDSGWETVEVEADHSSLISAAADDRSCGDDPDDHDWTSDGEGGLRENPGVWATGGTSMVFHSHCRRCGLHRVERSTGSQRNPGEHDTVEYRMLDDDEITEHIANGDMDEREGEE